MVQGQKVTLLLEVFQGADSFFIVVLSLFVGSDLMQPSFPRSSLPWEKKRGGET